jgi:outer membrane lipoprotein SlyB
MQPTRLSRMLIVCSAVVFVAIRHCARNPSASSWTTLGKRNRTGPEVRFGEIVALLGFQIKRHVWLLIRRGC